MVTMSILLLQAAFKLSIEACDRCNLPTVGGCGCKLTDRTTSATGCICRREQQVGHRTPRDMSLCLTTMLKQKQKQNAVTLVSVCPLIILARRKVIMHSTNIRCSRGKYRSGCRPGEDLSFDSEDETYKSAFTHMGTLPTEHVSSIVCGRPESGVIVTKKLRKSSSKPYMLTSSSPNRPEANIQETSDTHVRKPILRDLQCSRT